MTDIISPPPIAENQIDPRTKKLSRPWASWFRSIYQRLVSGGDAYMLNGAGTWTPVVRMSKLLIEDGTAADSIALTMTSVYEGEAIAKQDSLTAGGATAAFALSAGGDTITVDSDDLANDLNAAWLGGLLVKDITFTGAAPMAAAYVSSGDIVIEFRRGDSGAAPDLTAEIGTGTIEVYLVHI
jgi:hypothetical protein